MKRIAIAFLLLALCGCSDNPDTWEYCQQIPANTTPERLMEIRHLLEDNGYRRFKIYTVDWGRAVVIHATTKEKEEEERTRHIAELGRPRFWGGWWETPMHVITCGVFAVSTGNILDECKDSEAKE